MSRNVSRCPRGVHFSYSSIKLPTSEDFNYNLHWVPIYKQIPNPLARIPVKVHVTNSATWNFVGYISCIVFTKSTPIKCVGNPSVQLKLEGWLYIVFIFITLLNVEELFYWQFGRGGISLLVILVRRPHFIGYLSHLREESPFYWVNFGGG